MAVRALPAATLVGWLYATASAAQTAPAPAGHLGVIGQPVALPGMGQVILVFLFVSALAIGLAFALRRLSPGFLTRMQPGGGQIEVRARMSLERGVSMYIVRVEGERFVVVTGRSAVTLHALAPDRGTLPSAAPTRDP